MKFSDHIPNDVLRVSETKQYVTVMEETDKYKQQELNKSLRVYRSPLNTRTSFLLTRLHDHGFPQLPSTMPKDVLDALLLNMEDINALRGSKIGLQLWLWCLTFGTMIIDDSAFYPYPEFIQYSDPVQGYYNWFAPNAPVTMQNPGLYYFSDMSEFGVSQLDITINTKYSANQDVIDYINNNIRKYITWTDANTIINITFNSGIYVAHPHPHQYFVIP